MSDAINKECKEKPGPKCDVYPFGGMCCCNCMHQVKVFKHPKNKGFASGSVSKLLGWGCQVPQNGDVIFKDSDHGICEMYLKDIL